MKQFFLLFSMILTTTNTLTAMTVTREIKQEKIISNVSKQIIINTHIKGQERFSDSKLTKGWWIKNSKNYTLLNWKHYAASWSSFVINYPTFNVFNALVKEDVLQVNDITYTGTRIKRTSDIKFPEENNIMYYVLKNFTLKLSPSEFMEAWIKIWHFHENIYFNYTFKKYSITKRHYDFKVTICAITFNPK